MNSEDVLQIFITIVIAVAVFIAIPCLLNIQMQNQIPTERWCNAYNESSMPTISVHPDYKYWCFKNETGWHLNTSRPMILENVIT
jgi:hypothetical protein